MNCSDNCDDKCHWYSLDHERCCPALCWVKYWQSMTIMQHIIVWYCDRYCTSYSLVWRMPNWKYKDKYAKKKN